MITIVLNTLKFHAHHGVHEEESITGTGFEVNAEVKFSEAGNITSLEDTIDYTGLYRIIQESIHNRRKLLETVAMEIAETESASSAPLVPPRYAPKGTRPNPTAALTPPA